MSRTEKPPKPAHYLEWLAVKGLVSLVRAGSLDGAYRRIGGLSRLGRKILRSEWNWTLTNLKLVYGPNLSDAARERLATLVFRNLFFSHMEGMRVNEIQFENEGLQHLKAACEMERGVIICGVHVGSWEPGLKRLAEASGRPTVIVYRHANNPLSERVFQKLREPYGVEWVARRDPRGAMQALRDKKILGLMTDINIRQGGIAAPFLGLPAMTPVGPAKLAMRFGSPLLPIIATREAQGRSVFRVGEPIEPLAKGLGEKGEIMLTTRINTAFDDWIHTYAEQYNWLHARWRTRPDGALWRYDDPPIDQMWKSRTTPFATLSERVMKMIS
ncbi:MAG: lysophospholipid acyltransferase family protein [Magnetococcales bacterium]|nr:lysophospholipid acyltransferase family protein [Magnetococcales bacterium]